MTTVYTNEYYIEILRERLKPDRFEHSLNVADCAKDLAVRYGENPEKAYTAGLLHDIMKNAPYEEQLDVIEEAGIVMCECDRENKKLWHSIGGAEYIKKHFGITDEDFLNSIRFHTSGRAGMSLLEKVIYIADFNSADRVYKDVETMRILALESLERAMLYALKFSISEIAEKGKVLHVNSVHCYNELVIAEKNK